jgi:flagellar protein FliO/FliZ
MLKWLLSIIAAVCLSLAPLVVQADGVGQGKSVWDNVHDAKKSDEKVKQDKTELVEQSDSGSTFLMLVKLIFMLGVVLAILYFVLRFIQKKSVRFQDGKNLQSLGGIGVGQNRSVQLIKTGSSVLVLGVGDTVTLLKEITDETEIQSMIKQKQLPQVSSMTSQWKGKLLNRQDNHEAKESLENQTGNFKQMLNNLMSDRKEQREKLEKALEEGKQHE